MALPKINEALTLTMTIPSTGKRVKYRPYLVKEEKVLLQAFESGDLKVILDSMCDTITACLDEKENLEVEKLTTFDVEYMFLQLRTSSVGENSTVVIKCEECDTENSVHIDIPSIEMNVNEVENVIPITDEISVEMKFPTYGGVIDQTTVETDEDDPNAVLRIVAASISAVLTADERIDASSESTENLIDFLDSLTSAQFQKISEFLTNMPSLKKEVEFDCDNCKSHNKVTLEGLADFF